MTNILSRWFKKQANGTISDVTRSKLIKINTPTVSQPVAMASTVTKPSATVARADATLKAYKATPKPEPANATQVIIPKKSAAEERAEYEAWRKVEKLNDLQTKAATLDSKIKAAEYILTNAPYQKADDFKVMQQAHANLKKQKKALDLERASLGFKNPEPDQTPKELYYFFDGKYVLFFRDDKIWCLLMGAPFWGWLRTTSLNQDLATREDFKHLVEKKYTELELRKRFSVYYPNQFDLTSVFNSADENNKIWESYQRMKVDIDKATILY